MLDHRPDILISLTYLMSDLSKFRLATLSLARGAGCEGCEGCCPACLSHNILSMQANYEV